MHDPHVLGACPMPRRVLLAAVCVLLVGVAVFLTRRPERQAAASQVDAPKVEKDAGPSFVVAPYLQYATPTSITVMWETSAPGTSLVRYGVGGLTKTKDGEKN